VSARVLMIDNYDSFTYNLVQEFGALGAVVTVVRCDAVDAAGVAGLAPDALVISPGPGRPEEAGASIELVRVFSGKMPILGVCLGHQAIGAAFGAKVARAPAVVHGKTAAVHHDGRAPFAGVPSPFDATRYHSLMVEEESLAGTPLEVSARSGDGLLMAVAHREHPTYGFQFHPESVLTRHGPHILKNFLTIAQARR
jgi:anthranilate synthase/aminodeoxychorismate synthase-like glutamine amidotransferase